MAARPPGQGTACATIQSMKATTSPSDVRPSPIAGTWYPADPQALARSVDQQLEAAQQPHIPGQVMGLIVPHAGHRYSGGVAGSAFSCLRGQHPEVVAVVSPFHQLHPASLLTTGHRAYATPLGEVAIDSRALAELDAELERQKLPLLTPVLYDHEHALEIQLPFLQRVLRDPFELLPIMMRDQSSTVARGLGQALAEVLEQRASLLVASSDLSHFYPDPVARSLDAEMLKRIEAFDPQGVLDAEGEGVGFACGRAAIATVLWACQQLGADRVQLLGYATSGDRTGDFESVVGYGAAVIFRSDNR
jgi:AmmeMemoRadiSam system protein B